jgi:isoquinoline 1-oxidoreductase beta subunit
LRTLRPGAEPPPHLDAEGRFAPNPWLRIARDGTVTVIIDRSEMGQGVVTGLAMLIAEELEADPASLRIEFAPAAPAYVNPKLGEQLTGGSTSIRAAWQPLRQAGAAAREMLVSAAAQLWDVPRDTCRADNGYVIHRPSGRRLGFGALVNTAAALPLPAEVTLKPAAAFRLLGRSVPRIEVPDMVTGRAVNGIDVTLPGMLFAVVARCPVPGG